MRRWKRRLARLGIIVVILIAAGISEAVWERDSARSDGERLLAEQLDHLDAIDPGWRLNKLRLDQQKTDLPEEGNSSRQAVRTWERVPTSYRYSKERPLDRPALPPSLSLPKPRDAEAWRTELAPHGEVIVAARSLTGLRPGGVLREVPDNPLETRVPHIDAVFGLTHLLDLDARLAVADGDPPRAITDLAAALSLTAGLDGDWSYIVWKVRTVCGLRAAELTEQLLGWMPDAGPLCDQARALGAEGQTDRASQAVRGERAILDLLFERVDAGRVRPRRVFGEPSNDFERWMEPLSDWRFRGDLPADRAKMLEVLTGWLDAFRRPICERTEAFAAIELPPVEAPYLMTLTMLPSVGKLLALDLRAKARLRSAAVGLACERFRQTHGRWPNDLAELKDLLPTIPLDPYDGQPLRYRKLDDGAVVYAVGPDRSDDGGTLSYGNPQPGEDVGFRLWDVAARRQPPPEDRP